MFMNRVHEQCPKNLTQENTESKRIENGPSAPSAQPATRPRAQRPGRAPATQPALPHTLRARPRLLPLACRARACLPRARLLAAPAPQRLAPACRPPVPRACYLRAPRAPSTCAPRERPLPARPARALYARAPTPQRPARPNAPPAHPAARPAPAYAPSTPSRAPSCPVHCHNTKFCIVTQPLNQSPAIQPRNIKLYCDTVFPATQSLLQHRPVYCNTLLAPCSL